MTNPTERSPQKSAFASPGDSVSEYRDRPSQLPSRLLLVDDLRTVQPSVFVGVPTVYERLHEAIEDRREESGGLTGSLASGVAESVGNAKTESRSVSTSLSLKHAIANRTVFADLREEVGLGNIEYALTGTAAIDRELLEFFRRVRCAAERNLRRN